jgi:hypothetical protein
MGQGSARAARIDSAMKRPAKDSIREERIHEEAIVDAHGSEEKAMSWYYYLEGKLIFPFQARCSGSRVVSPLKKGEPVEVRRMASEDACLNDMLVRIQWQGRSLVVPLSNSSPSTPMRTPPKRLATGIIG